MMVLFLHAARIAMITFDPYLSSQPLAAALSRSPSGRVIIDDQYYMFASIFFYSDLERAWLLNGRVTNLEYGAYAPGAPNVFIDDERFSQMWRESERTYLLVEKPQLPRIMALVGRDNLHVVKESGGKFLFTNLPASEGSASP